jgi:uncharacterized YigZ family protein
VRDEEGRPGSRDHVDSYTSLGDGPEIEIREKGSKFIAEAFGVADDESLCGRLEATRRRYHDATHHCHAVRLGPPERTLERADDDGEPSGTAGLPLLAALRGSRLLDSGVIVTRYFGGVKLGTGGLARAYAAAAAEAIASAPRRDVRLDRIIRVTCSYDDVGAIEAMLSRESSVVTSVRREFGSAAVFHIEARRSSSTRLAAEFTEATGGRGDVSLDETADSRGDVTR